MVQKEDEDEKADHTSRTRRQLEVLCQRLRPTVLLREAEELEEA